LTAFGDLVGHLGLDLTFLARLQIGRLSALPPSSMRRPKFRENCSTSTAPTLAGFRRHLLVHGLACVRAGRLAARKPLDIFAFSSLHRDFTVLG